MVLNDRSVNAMLQTCCDEVKPVTIKSPCSTQLDPQLPIVILRLTNHYGLHTIEQSYNNKKNAKVMLMPTEPQAHNALEVENLHKSFGANDVLKGISMCAKDGEVWSIIGSSGSGKSTFLRCLNLLELPSQGHISLAGEAIEFKRNLQGHILRPTRQKQIQRLRTNMGMVFQSFNLWQHQTVLKNIIEAPIHVLGIDKAQAIDEAERLLNRVGLWDKRDAYPMHLSGGQQQRAAIARALAMQPKMMLFDEPTSALDPELVGEVLKVIRGIAEEGRTMIMVTHEMRFARDVSNQIMFLHEGCIEEQGSPQKVFYESESARCRAFLSRVN